MCPKPENKIYGQLDRDDNNNIIDFLLYLLIKQLSNAQSETFI